MLFLLLSFIICLVIGKLFLSFLTKKGIIQPIYDDAPEMHKQKQGTPTMGGITFLGTFLAMMPVLMIYVSKVDSHATTILPLIIGTIIILGYGFIGFKDDYLKVTNRRNESGLTPKQKLILQFIISAIIIGLLMVNHHDTTVNLGLFTISGLLYYLIIPVMIVGFSNATNLTDGLDGLLSSVSVFVFTTLAFIAGLQGNVAIEVLALTVVGALLAFLTYNWNPAKMFMGDTGSLVLGALYAYMIIALKIELLGLLLGAVYIFEVLSVVMQVTYFKYTKRKTGEGKRIFKMAPFHHHLEKSGLNEKKIVFIFIGVQILLNILVLFFYSM